MAVPIRRALPARDGLRPAERRHRAPSTRNPIIAWLLAKSTPLQAYLDGLAALDLKLAAGRGQVRSLLHARQRLALTLVLDFAREQGLSIRELTLLLDDVHGAACDAMNHLIESSRGERRAANA